MQNRYAEQTYATNAVDTSYMGAGTATGGPSNACRDASPLEHAVNRLQSRIDSLDLMASGLEQQLLPILNDPVPTKERNEAMPIQATPLLRALDSVEGRLAALNERLAQISSRIVL